MNFEKQVLKQSQEQPAYITSEHMLRMQRASMIRYEKSTYSLSLLPLFFAFSDELIKETDEFMKKLAVIQKCFVQARTDLELSTAISGMCRTVRSLPILLKNQPIVSTANHPTLLPAHTSFDLVYHYFSDSSIDVADFSQKLSSLYSQDFKVIKHFGGAFIIDPTIKKELTIQNSCNYTPYDPNIEIPPVSEVATPDCSTIEDLSKFTGKSKTDLVKAVMYKVDGRLVFVNIRGDLDVSEEKLRHFLGISGTNIEIQLAPPELLEKHGLVPGFSGLIGLKRASECTIIVDNSVQTVAAGVTGANKKDFHYINFNVARDTKKISKFIRYADVATNPSVVEGAVVAEIEDLHDCYPEMLGLDSKRTRTPLYKK
ncbi:proline--tRNA ligase [Histomonas meleagridis]|uniref:proline--tRNA ligase n=1 Tax=Histomonas meleagridis TaxID=135588 RepID=UPI003559FD94|nr:proline--tRNA ligase [Histomonas meleagridis]